LAQNCRLNFLQRARVGLYRSKLMGFCNNLIILILIEMESNFLTPLWLPPKWGEWFQITLFCLSMPGVLVQIGKV
jgi:hypothetical protein